MAPRNSNKPNTDNPVSLVPSHSHNYSESSHSHNYSPSGHTHNYAESRHTHPYSDSGHNHDLDYFPYEGVLKEITNQVNDKWGDSTIGTHEKDAREYRDLIVNTYEPNSKSARDMIVNTYKPETKTARDETFIFRDNARKASNEAKKLLTKVHEDYQKIVNLGIKSHALAEIIANLAMHSKVLNSAIRTSTHLANAPFDLNAINEENVASVIANAIRDPLNNIGEFSYSGYTSGDYEKDIKKIELLRKAITSVDMSINYVTYRNKIANALDDYTYKTVDNYDDSVVGGIKNLLPDKLKNALIKLEGSMGFTNMQEGFTGLDSLCGSGTVTGTRTYYSGDDIDPNSEQVSDNERRRMCNAYFNKSETNENIVELEELLAQKKNLASDVMLNYIINEDNNNQSTIKQVYDKINDENNLKLRKIKDKEYNNKKNIDNLKILKFAILLFFISVPFLMLHKKEIISINLLFFIIFMLIIIFVIFSGTIIYKQLAADKFNYNKIDKTINNLNTIKKSTSGRETERILNNDMTKFSSIFGCFNSNCCEEGTTYDSNVGKCITR